MQLSTRIVTSLATVGMLALFSASAMAQKPTTAAPGQAVPPNPPGQTTQSGRMGQMDQMGNTTGTNAATSDNTFVKKAAEGGMAEVELGNLAVQKATNPDVKQFGQRMVDDHSKANDEIRPLASKQGVTIPTKLAHKDQALKNRLEKLSGEAFDKAYMEAMVKDHRADVNAFRQEADHGTDPDVKSFASKTLPTLQEHLKLADETLNKVKGQGTAAREK